MTEFYEKALELFNSKISFVTVTLINVKGHAPQEEGAKIIVTQEGRAFGTVGGGKIEFKATEHARNLLLTSSQRKNCTELVTWNLRLDVGMTCGGEASFLFEVTRLRAWEIVVFGAGHVAQQLIPILITLNCSISCVDHRQEWIERLPKSPKLRATIHDRPLELVQRFSQNCFFVVLTQGHATDLPVVTEIFKTFKDPFYVGCMGSPVKASKMKKELCELGIPSIQIEKLHCPIGLEIGGNDPSEIAISIASQLLKERTNFQELK